MHLCIYDPSSPSESNAVYGCVIQSGWGMEALTNATWHVEDVRQHHSDLGVPFPHRGQVHHVNLRLHMKAHEDFSYGGVTGRVFTVEGALNFVCGSWMPIFA